MLRLVFRILRLVVLVYWAAGRVRLPTVSLISNLLDLRCVCRVFNRLLPESSGFLAGLVVAQYKMPPRRRGRSRGLFQESGGQNEDQYSAPSHTLESSGEEEAATPPAPVERMDVVIARFQRMSPPIFNGDESSEDADSWLHSVIHLFDRAQYDDDLRLRLVTLLLRKSAERWWRGCEDERQFRTLISL
ncbi:hypothetical protein F511_38544 [Dorcoceras hygrometricum]|uniref:Uncharacterized protein n=1 Tax=Dorcoceras hygrometricum TaxID=472368 RepID=A0A2Z7D3B3_9LAMI|nr:hypothetical protein F511_38544 [Dorcoceras hygrometricum]